MMFGIFGLAAVKQQARWKVRRAQAEAVALAGRVEQQAQDRNRAVVVPARAAYRKEPLLRIVPGFAGDDFAIVIVPIDIEDARSDFDLAVQKVPAAQHRMLAAQSREPRNVIRELLPRRRLRLVPVEPRDLVVQTI